MSLDTYLKCKFIACSSLASAGLTSLQSAMAGATGAAILSKAGYVGHVIKESASISAQGGCVVGAFTGAFGAAIALRTNGLFRTPPSFGVASVLNCCVVPAAILGLQSLASSIGHVLATKFASSTMTMGQVVADSAVGASVIAIPLSVGTLCCFSLLVEGVRHQIDQINRTVTEEDLLNESKSDDVLSSYQRL